MVILFDQFNLPDDVYKVIFATEQQEVVGKMLISYMLDNGGEIGKTEMSLFATQLHDGKAVIKPSPYRIPRINISHLLVVVLCNLFCRS